MRTGVSATSGGSVTGEGAGAGAGAGAAGAVNDEAPPSPPPHPASVTVDSVAQAHSQLRAFIAALQFVVVVRCMDCASDLDKHSALQTTARKRGANAPSAGVEATDRRSDRGAVIASDALRAESPRR